MSPSLDYLAGYSVAELMASVIAREVRDGEQNASGTLSPIAAAGLCLAQELYTPKAGVIMLGDTPQPYMMGAKEFFDWAQRGQLDLFFLSGAQIDRRGNINLTAIGDYDSPKVRLPGGAGSGMLYYMAKRVILFKTDHNTRGLVEKVDFTTSAGTVDGNVHRPGGPWKLVTPLCVFKFERAAGEFVLESVHPGVGVDEVVSNTGWRIQADRSVMVTPPPSKDELRLLRTVVRERVRTIYPEFAASAIQPWTE